VRYEKVEGRHRCWKGHVESWAVLALTQIRIGEVVKVVAEERICRICEGPTALESILNLAGQE